ncbi:hypothetical protein SAMN05444858_11026 [Micromonospora avicenniae]|uniref:Uncharacterized protein n=1 Tax=Micromonospora avicenniae TaxID=1198245 RepID=A0A1N7AZ45_9ACTN|nr:hypothetical protein SAMN05444858_11026 [Micromonospora avicenniae]
MASSGARKVIWIAIAVAVVVLVIVIIAMMSDDAGGSY